LRAIRFESLRTNRFGLGRLGCESLVLNLGEDIGRRAALPGIGLQAPPRNFAERLRNRFRDGAPSLIAILQLRFSLRQDGNQSDPERPNIGCRGEAAAVKLRRVVRAGRPSAAAHSALAKSVSGNLQMVVDCHDVRRSDVAVR
jgi:hypothetical protein